MEAKRIEVLLKLNEHGCAQRSMIEWSENAPEIELDAMLVLIKDLEAQLEKSRLTAKYIIRMTALNK